MGTLATFVSPGTKERRESQETFPVARRRGPR
jgi:hypothetical protein